MEADGRMDFVVDLNIVTPRVSVATSAILRRVLVLQKVNNMRSPPLEFSLSQAAGSQDTGRVPAQESKGHVKIDFNWVFIHLRKMTAKKKKMNLS